MFLKLIPGVAVPIPLTAYYSITFVSLFVGNSGITSCNLRIGNKIIGFKLGNYPEKEILTVNGDPRNTPVHILMPRTENSILLKLPETAPANAPDAEIFLFYQLSYSVPKEKPLAGNTMNVIEYIEN